MDQNQELALAHMRELVQKLGYSSEGYGDPTLMRFLIARSLNTEKAANMFVQWQKWRASFVPLGCIPDSEVEDELSGEKIYLQGLSTKGTSVVIIKAWKHYPSKDQPQFKKFVVHILDKAIASSIQGEEIGNEKLTAIIDLEKLSYKNVDARGLITGFQFLQAYYPECLAKLYILNMPGFFVRVWRFVSRFLEKATQEKVVIVTSEDEKREFVKDIGEEALPEEYGGQAKLVLIQDAQLKPLNG
ncbi:Sec14p-like phosphatidylinositol transfer family protein [Striga asiatica]|uniref:Sec14p-like phosphatidylinositol transfer family protein n=1 Tax=Striga asiatica TaxID=4170 RepID=A0A5A7PX07_STRAF|nr:Sec14p-like phosphatidylinositol transfer family protein [Striga asiatica]